MSIRKHNKDHLREIAPALAEASDPKKFHQTESPLCFWTVHENPTLVDLTVFAVGDNSVANVVGTRLGGFSGRPLLIEELAPVMKALMEYYTPATCARYLSSLRSWWRLFDAVECRDQPQGTNIKPVHSVEHITEIHRQRAHDENMNRGLFGCSLVLFNIARKHKGLRPLHWKPMERREPIRHLPPEWQIRKLRIYLKHRWFEALFRWQTADELLSGRHTVNQEEERLKRNYLRFRDVVIRSGNPRPTARELFSDFSGTRYLKQGYSVSDMLRGTYPDSETIRYAFFLCLANTGWNAAVFLSLSTNRTFIESHPKDPSRYLLRGFKTRAGTEQVSEGLYKSKGSVGVILQTLVQRTEPLRARLKLQLYQESQQYTEMIAANSSEAELNSQRKLIERLREGASAIWIYVTAKTDEIVWLARDERNHATTGPSSFLSIVISRINEDQPLEKKLSPLKPSDLRDAFAAYAFRISGGMILYVMKALGHRSLKSTQAYLNNTLINAQSENLYRNFSNSLWDEIKLHGRLDPTIIASNSRYGITTQRELSRLEEYRTLRRSRIGVGCKDPTHPPKSIAPNFQVNGKSMCHVQRCMLCSEHAVIFPDSLSGICKRLAELRTIKSQMSTLAFLESSFGQEMENINIILNGFEAAERDQFTLYWEQRIAEGSHLVIDIDGLQKVNV
ncbi:hypothetical protein HD842_004049 [Massilia aurea]|uniref:Integrase n=1 Tax=Massilia aurea TaxID=373040 RepID=A0A7W9X3J6_9BURK|nr:hypothetical protein [Massilia aurea]MBB6135872.1 hypothetical protein [Massilia aurea]